MILFLPAAVILTIPIAFLSRGSIFVDCSVLGALPAACTLFYLGWRYHYWPCARCRKPYFCRDFGSGHTGVQYCEHCGLPKWQVDDDPNS